MDLELQTTHLSKKRILLIFLIGFILSFVIKDFSIFKPISFYITSVHEVCHGLAAILTGGELVNINLSSQGGVASSRGGWFPIISMAGYIGTTIIGLIFLYVSKKESYTDITLWIFSLMMIVLNIIYIESFFNLYFISSIVLSLLIFASTKLHFTRYIAVFLSSLFIFDSFTDAKLYLFSFFFGKTSELQNWVYTTDAGILARHIGIESLALPIAIFIFVINLMLIYLVFKRMVKD